MLVKAQLGNDIRRVQVDDTVTFDELHSRVCALFGVPREVAQLRYTDDEHDRVTIASCEELREAIRIARSMSPAAAPDAVTRLRVDVVVKDGPRQVQPAKSISKEEAPAPTGSSATPSSSSSANASTSSSTAPRPSQSHAPTGGVGGFLASVLQKYFPCRNLGSTSHCVVDLDLTQYLDTLEELLNNPTTRDQLRSTVENFAAQMHALVQQHRQQQQRQSQQQHEQERKVAVMQQQFSLFQQLKQQQQQQQEQQEQQQEQHQQSQSQSQSQSQGQQGQQQCQEQLAAQMPTLADLAHPFAAWFRPRGAARPGPFSRGPRGMGARFMADVTIPDGSAVAGGTRFVKTWRLRNTGSHPWPTDCQLVFVGGDDLRAGVEPAIPSAAPGEEVDISVECQAPPAGGRYVTYFRLATSTGERFGQRVWLDILVPAMDASSAMEPLADEPTPVVDEFSAAQHAAASMASAVVDAVVAAAAAEGSSASSTPPTGSQAHGSVAESAAEVAMETAAEAALEAVAAAVASAASNASNSNQNSSTDKAPDSPVSTGSSSFEEVTAADAEEPITTEVVQEAEAAPQQSEQVPASDALPAMNPHMSASSEQLQMEAAQLVSMGFFDCDLNIHLLRKFNHDLPRVIEALLEQSDEWTVVADNNNSN